MNASTSSQTVSVVIPFYGDPAETLPLVQAMLEQNTAPLEVVVSDDCSPIPFPATPGVKLLRSDRNGGFGSAVNAGAKVATGDLLLVLNSDLEVDHTFVAQLIAAAGRWQPAVVSPGVRESGRVVATGKRWPSVRGAFFAWLTPLARIRNGRVWNWLVGHYDTSSMRASGQKVDWVVGACMLIPRAEFWQVGGFDERYFMNSEEIDLQRRLAEVGIDAVVVPVVTVGHVGGGSSDPGRRRQWVVDGMFIYATKWGHATELALALRTASRLNLVWNWLRHFRDARVDPRATFREELALITHGVRVGNLTRSSSSAATNPSPNRHVDDD